MASSSAAWVLGGVRLISSARMTLANSGPSRKRNSRPPVVRFSSMTSVPVSSDGIRSGVNWMRLNASDNVLASVLIMSVLASPGTPSRMQWPRLKSAISNSSMTVSWPTMTRPSCALRSLKASRNLRTASISPASRGAVSLMQFSWVSRKRLSLVNRQGPVVELQDGQVAGGREHRADVALRPAAVLVLPRHQVVEDHVAVLAPRQPVRRLRVGEHLPVPLLAQDVEHLCVVIV